jgi:glyoxylase-like metal-dependent hydrolase (beta-lactamase superfamily II)
MEVYRIQIQTPTVARISSYLTNVYLLAEGKECILIDSGPDFGYSEKAISNFLKRHPLILKRAVITHEHPDHIGGVGEIRKWKIQIAAHKIAVDEIKKYRDYSFPRYLFKRIDESLVGFYEERTRKISSIRIDLKLERGYITVGNSKLHIIHTPGHSPGHICLFEKEEKILFSGDVVIGKGTPYIGQDPFTPIKGDLRNYLSSLRKLLKMDIERIFPADGPPCRKDRINEIIERKEERERKILSILRKEGKTLRQLTKEVYTEEISKTPKGWKDFQLGFLQTSMLAYLEKMEKEAKIEKTGNTYSVR